MAVHGGPATIPKWDCTKSASHACPRITEVTSYYQSNCPTLAQLA
jgi:hypothetical protein